MRIFSGENLELLKFYLYQKTPQKLLFKNGGKTWTVIAVCGENEVWKLSFATMIKVMASI